MQTTVMYRDSFVLKQHNDTLGEYKYSNCQPIEINEPPNYFVYKW